MFIDACYIAIQSEGMELEIKYVPKGNVSSNLTLRHLLYFTSLCGDFALKQKAVLEINCVLLPVYRALFGSSRAAEIYYNKPSFFWTCRSVRMGYPSTSRSRLPNAVKECGGGKCNHHVQMKINSQRISKVYRRYAVY
jgi:hypothetical protein